MKKHDGEGVDAAGSGRGHRHANREDVTRVVKHANPRTTNVAEDSRLAVEARTNNGGD